MIAGATGSAGRIIRALAPGDIAALQKIDHVAHGAPWSHRTFVDELERDDRLHLVAESGGTVVGHASAWIDERCCRITNVAVDTGQVGNGHASVLLSALLRQVLNEHRIANVQLEVRPANRRAQRLYGRFGFMPVGIERDFYDRSDEQGSRDAVVMAVPDVCADAWRKRLEEIHESSTGAAA